MKKTRFRRVFFILLLRSAFAGFCGVEGSAQELFNFNTLFQNRCILIVSAFDQQLQPILTFRAFLQSKKNQ